MYIGHIEQLSSPAYVRNQTLDPGIEMLGTPIRPLDLTYRPMSSTYYSNAVP